MSDVSVCYCCTLKTKNTLLFKQNVPKLINQYDFHKVKLTGSTRLTIALLQNNNPDTRGLKIRWNAHSVFQYFALAYSLQHSTRLNYLAEQNQVNIATSDRVSYQFLSHVYPFMRVTYSSGRETPSLKTGSVFFSYYFLGGRLPALYWLVGAPPICHYRHMAKKGHED